MSTNPYATPRAAVSDATQAGEASLVPGGRGVGSGRGWDWIAEGWALFRAAPWMWIALVLVSFVIVVVLGVIPFVGGLALSLLGPVFFGGIMIGCRSLDEGGGLDVGHLFAGFKERPGPLIALGAIYLVASIAIFVVAALVTGASVFGMLAGGMQDPAAVAAALTTFALLALVLLALSMPLLMAIWFAPALVVFHNLGPVEAMKQSFTGCLRNVVPFLVYGVVMLLLGVLASIPFGLGWLPFPPAPRPCALSPPRAISSACSCPT